jgi:hypothetical protein
MMKILELLDSIQTKKGLLEEEQLLREKKRRLDEAKEELARLNENLLQNEIEAIDM